LWCVRTRSLWWIDVDAARLHRFTPSTSAHEVIPIKSQVLGSIALRRDGDLVLALGNRVALYDAETRALTPFVAVEPDELDTRLNDGRCDAAGRLWIGTMDNGLTRGLGSFYRIDPDRRVIRQFGDVIVSNTVAIAPDQRTLYFSDTRRFVTWAFDLDAAE